MKRNPTILGSAARTAEPTGASPQKMRGKVQRAGALCVVIASLVALGACGQKGPLYLPSPNNGAPSTSVAPAAK